jgi:hypothetical protein
MLAENAIALKEWAAVCAALESGRQTVLLRKGGIAEGPRGFRIEHAEFWLYPTQFHQDASQLSEDGRSLLTIAQQAIPEAGRISVSLYAVCDLVEFVEDVDRLAEFRDRHVLSDAAVQQRFHYRSPGLYVATVRVLRREPVCDVPELPRYAGCKSWVELDQALVTDGLEPVGV